MRQAADHLVKSFHSHHPLSLWSPPKGSGLLSYSSSFLQLSDVSRKTSVGDLNQPTVETPGLLALFVSADQNNRLPVWVKRKGEPPDSVELEAKLLHVREA
jgi:hypothetical protein